jgi:DNA polymerase-3 subunit epsilon
MNFITIDFETANEKYYSACALGMVVVENGQTTNENYWLIKPPEMRFNSFNISLHGITAKDVCDKPEFNKLWDEIKNNFDNRLVFAHNASFDIYVLKDLLDYYEIPHPKIKYACTVKLSQKIWVLNNYKLDTVANHLNYEFNHHNAASDAKTCAEIVLRGCSEVKAINVEDLLKQLKIRKKPFPEKDNITHEINTNNTKSYKYKEEVKYIKLENTGKCLQNIGCILTLFITVPIVVIIIFLVMCSR